MRNHKSLFSLSRQENGKVAETRQFLTHSRWKAEKPLYYQHENLWTGKLENKRNYGGEWKKWHQTNGTEGRRKKVKRRNFNQTLCFLHLVSFFLLLNDFRRWSLCSVEVWGNIKRISLHFCLGRTEQKKKTSPQFIVSPHTHNAAPRRRVVSHISVNFIFI